jgi:hypothetical protein
MTTLHITDRIELYNGSINGWDRWINERYLWGYIGELSWTSRNDQHKLNFAAIWGKRPPNPFVQCAAGCGPAFHVVGMDLCHGR